jgi:hypothetical protein
MKNRSFRRIIQSAYKFLAGPLCFSFPAINQSHKNSVNISFWPKPKQNTPHYFLTFNEFQHSALEMSGLSVFTLHFRGAKAETASNIHILHNHNLWSVLSYSKSAKAMSHVTM